MASDYQMSHERLMQFLAIGRQAFVSGAPSESCPKVYGVFEVRAWQLGWRLAESEHQALIRFGNPGLRRI